MDFKIYLDKFQEVAAQLDKDMLHKKQIEVAVVVVLNSVCLKLYKKSWVSPLQDPLIAESRIFFSVWVNDSILAEQKIFYNIHALKLRHLKGYRIQSRKFADRFRENFKAEAHQWPNVSVAFGPLTLMEGWLNIDPESFKDDILDLSNRFLAMSHLVDDTLSDFLSKP